MTTRTATIGSFLTPATRDEPVNREATYSMMGVRSFGRGAFAAAPLNGDATSYANLRKVEEGDVVYPKLMAWEGAFALVSPELAGRWVSPEFCVFEVDETEADRRYVSHLLSWEGLRDGLVGQSSGTNARRRRLQPHSFCAHHVPLPNIPEQRRIANHLDRIATSAETIYRSTQRHLVAKRALAGHALRSTDTISTPISQLLELQREPVRIESNGKYRRIGIYSWGKGFLHRPAVPGIEMGSLRYFTIPEKALVLSNIQAWEAAIAVSGSAENGHVASNRFLSYTLIDESKASVDYLLYYFLSESGLTALRRASPGTQVRNRTLGQKLFEATAVPLPDLPEQLRVVAHVDKLEQASQLISRRATLASALLSAARNEVFNALR